MKVLTIIRGVSGSGKSTLANAIASYYGTDFVEADQYFTKEGGFYDFDASKLKDAHKWCKEYVEVCMQDKQQNIIVSNTFTRRWEYEPYLDLASNYGYTVQTIIVDAPFDNVHDVPFEVVMKQKERFEYE